MSEFEDGESDEGKLKANGLQLCQSSILMDGRGHTFPPEHWPKHRASPVSLHLPTMHLDAMCPPD